MTNEYYTSPARGRSLLRSALLGMSMLASGAAVLPAHAGKADDTLTVVFTKELDTADVYFTSVREGNLLSFSGWDALLYRDVETGEYKGNLATAWEWIDETTIEFTLREGVKFHNGEEFDADDAVFTINTMADPNSGIRNVNSVRWLKGAEKLDKYKIRVFLDKPFPAALEYFSVFIIMYPKDYYSAVGSAGMASAPIGTGPYRFESMQPGQGFTLVRNEDYHDSPKGKPGIGKVVVRTIPDVNTQIAELMNGTVDFLWQVPQDQADRLAGRDNFQVLNAPTMRVGYLTMDAVSRTMDKSPMADVRVRRAINHAIDRQGILDALIPGNSELVNSACAPSQFGCETDVPVYEYNPELAKSLLAEAGYPDGFTTDFYIYRDRPLAEAMVNMLAEVGIKTEMKTLQYAALVEQQLQDKIPFSFQTWGSGSVGDVSAITAALFDLSGRDDARDEEVTALLRQGNSSNDPETRKEHYSKALKLIAERAYWVPLWLYSTNYVTSTEVDFTPTADEYVRFYDLNWK